MFCELSDRSLDVTTGASLDAPATDVTPGASLVAAPTDVIPGVSLVPPPTDVTPGASLVAPPTDVTPGASFVAPPTGVTPGASLVAPPTGVTPGASLVAPPTDVTPGAFLVDPPADVTPGASLVTPLTGVTPAASLVARPTDVTPGASLVAPPTDVTPGASLVAPPTGVTPGASLVAPPTDVTPGVSLVAQPTDVTPGAYFVAPATDVTPGASLDMQPLALGTKASSCISFGDLVEIPKRKRGTGKPRAKLPSYDLTSYQHLKLVEDKRVKKQNVAKPSLKRNKPELLENNNPPKRAKEKAVRTQKLSARKVNEGSGTISVDLSSSLVSSDHEKSPCSVCLVVYGHVGDKKKNEEWFKCHRCQSWFRDTCDQSNGLFDDDYFTCKNCFSK